ncbi:3'(2'),5'-bisphosphate nucleotidase [Gammaproteobacteria bacterium]
MNHDRPPMAALLAIAKAAADAILAVYDRGFEVTAKADHSPLTEADLAAHRVIVESLATLTPGWPLLSEESAAVPWTERQTWSRYWLVDPLDGTKEFIRRNGEFTVNIALIEQGRPVLGVVWVPVTGLAYWAAAGVAYSQIPGGPARQLRVSAPCQTPVRVVGSRSHAGDSLAAFLARLGEHQLVSMGSSLKLCLVAEGKADVYPRLGPTSAWDTAAAQAVVEGAGGQVTDLCGVPLCYNTRESLLNPHFLVFGDASRDWFTCLPPERLSSERPAP